MQTIVKFINSYTNKKILFIYILLFSFLGALYAISYIAMHLLRLENTILPWTCLLLLKNGFIMPVFIGIIFITFTFFSLYFCVKGGIQRTYGNYLLGLLGILILSGFLSAYFFKFWQGLETLPSPWLGYTILTRFSSDSLAFKHYLISLLSCIIFLTFLFLLKHFTGLSKVEKIFGSAHFASSYEINSMGLFKENGVVLGKAFGKALKLPGFESILVTAPTGSGKTTSIAIPNLLEWTGSGIFNDLKGELYNLTAQYREKVLGNKCHCFSPADADMRTEKYNPFFYVSKNPNLRVRDLQLIAEILIPAERVDGGFWYSSSRDIFLMLAIYLIEINGIATLAEIHDLSKQENFFEWLSLIVVEQRIEDPIFYQNANSILNADQDKTQKNILKDFHSRMMLFSDPIIRNATSANTFNITNIRREKISIYIHIPDSDKQRLKPILTLFWAQAINVLTQHEPDNLKEPFPILALLDEFGNMARIEKLKDGISFLRSFQIRSIIIVQYLSQLISVYGQHDAKAFLNCKVKIAYALNDIDDAKFFSESMGKKTVKVKSRGSTSGQHASSSENINFQSRNLMTPDEIMQMKSDDEIILIESSFPIKARKKYWYKDFKYVHALELLKSSDLKSRTKNKLKNGERNENL